MIIKLGKLFFIILMAIILVYASFFTITEINKMNVMRWRDISSQWITNIKNINIDLSKEKFLADEQDCMEVQYTDLRFHFNIDISNQINNHIFLIESIRFNKILYKGNFLTHITIKKVPYCIQYKHAPNNVEIDIYDALTFRLFDIENKRAVFWGGDYGYPYYNGKVNQVTFFRNHSNQYHGYYKVEQGDV